MTRRAPALLEPVKWDFPFGFVRDGNRVFLTDTAIRYLQQLFGAIQWEGGVLDQSALTSSMANLENSQIAERVEALEQEIGRLRSALASQPEPDGRFIPMPTQPDTVVLSTGARITSGNGTPEAVVYGKLGDLFLRLDGGATTTLYVKTADTGLNTGWTAK